jgi:hypothetical protein
MNVINDGHRTKPWTANAARLRTGTSGAGAA